MGKVLPLLLFFIFHCSTFSSEAGGFRDEVRDNIQTRDLEKWEMQLMGKEEDRKGQKTALDSRHSRDLKTDKSPATNDTQRQNPSTATMHTSTSTEEMTGTTSPSPNTSSASEYTISESTDASNVPVFTSTPPEDTTFSSPDTSSTTEDITTDASTVSTFTSVTQESTSFSSPDTSSTTEDITTDASTVSTLTSVTPESTSFPSPDTSSTTEDITTDASTVSTLTSVTPESTSFPSPDTSSTTEDITTDASTVSTLTSVTPESTSFPSPDTSSTTEDITTDASTVSTLTSVTPESTSFPSPDTSSTTEDITTDASTVSTLTSVTPESTSFPSPDTSSTTEDITTDASTVSTLTSVTPESTSFSSPDTSSTTEDITTDASTVSTLTSVTPEGTSFSSPDTSSTTEDITSESTVASTYITTTTTTIVTNNSTIVSDMTTPQVSTINSTISPPATPTNPDTQSSHTTTPQENKCENGGTYDGVKCLCLDNLFHGPRCELGNDEIVSATLNVPMELDAQVKITNRLYQKEYNDTNSTEFKKLKAEFKMEMRQIYKNVDGYRDVEIVSVMNGSIDVNFTIIMEIKMPNNVSAIDREVGNRTKELVKQLEDASANSCTPQDQDYCFRVLVPPALIRNFSAEDYCKNITTSNYSAYYYADTSTGILRCITNCIKDTKTSWNCHYGECRVLQTGPVCLCSDMDKFWYTGDFCETRFQKSEVGLGIGLAILFVASAVLAFFLFRAMRQKSKESFLDGEELWYVEDEEEEWKPPGGLSIMNKAAYVDGLEGRKRVFRPTLDAVDTEMQLRFQKPNITSQL
nr:mucin-3B-like [Zootoca vivipara]